MNPLQDFLKYAQDKSKVKAHTRQSKKGVSHVKPHERTKKDKKPSKKELEAEAAEKEKALRARQAKELEMWRTWNEGGRTVKDLRPLLKSFRPMIQAKANVYKGNVRIPDASIDAEFQIQFVNALRSYNPEKGSLGTYVYKYLDKAKRFIVETQNIGRIPENRAYKIKQYSVAVDELKEELGEQPSLEQISKRLGWSLAEVDRMDSEDRSDFTTQAFVEDPNAIIPSRNQEVLRLFKYELTGNEREVYEYLMGQGKPQIDSTSEIAKRMGLKDYQVSRIKLAIRTKIRRYVSGD